MVDDWRSDKPEPEPEEMDVPDEEPSFVADEPTLTAAAQEPLVVAHFEPEVDGLGQDGSTPAEGGIEGRLNHAGGLVESEGNRRDWQPYVEVDQPVQKGDI